VVSLLGVVPLSGLEYDDESAGFGEYHPGRFGKSSYFVISGSQVPKTLIRETTSVMFDCLPLLAITRVAVC
jgi:hypothetical protein